MYSFSADWMRRMSRMCRLSRLATSLLEQLRQVERDVEKQERTAGQYAHPNRPGTAAARRPAAADAPVAIADDHQRRAVRDGNLQRTEDSVQQHDRGQDGNEK
jgi:hypothetical protein